MSASDDSERPLILISNDDGIEAAGIKELANVLAPIGDCIVVAPNEDQSGSSHAITVRQPVRALVYPFECEHGALKAYSVRGTPVDCVKLAIDQLLPRRPDIVVSGINHGPNAAINTIYSGTVSAALEGAILGINAIAFSVGEWNGGDYPIPRSYIQRIVQTIADHPLPVGVLLNVNIPNAPEQDIKGIKVTRQAESRWQESFVARKDPTNQPYYWIAGEFVNLDEGTDTDLSALAEGWISITPLRPDLTAHDLIQHIKSLPF